MRKIVTTVTFIYLLEMAADIEKKRKAISFLKRAGEWRPVKLFFFSRLKHCELIYIKPRLSINLNGMKVMLVQETF